MSERRSVPDLQGRDIGESMVAWQRRLSQPTEPGHPGEPRTTAVDEAGLDVDGLHIARPASITTWSRRRVEPMALTPADIRIEDIAHALARQCRYNGHTGGHLSVARHSLWVSDALREYGPRMMLSGLLHDAAEAFLGDVPRPLKQSPAFAAFRVADERADRVICEAFGLPHPLPDVVHEADRRVLFDRELDDARWNWDSTPDVDEAAFLHRFRVLIGGGPLTRPIVGLMGYAGAGKDAAAAALVARGWEAHAFASVLKLVAKRVGWNGEKDERGRRLLQDLGVGARELIDPDVWVKTLEADVDSHADPAVITDVRFPNEIEWIRDRGGIVVRIDRPGTGPANAHVSEHVWCDVIPDEVIVNDGTLKQLGDRVVAAVQHFDR